MDLPIDCICFNLRKAARAVSRTYDEALAEVGVRNTQFTLLAIVHELGPVGVTEIADVAVMERTTLTRNLALLEREKLVTSAAGKDRRKREVSLTKLGRTKLKAALPVWRRAQKQMTNELGAARKERLLQDLEFTARREG